MFGGESGHHPISFQHVGQPGFNGIAPSWSPLALAICHGQTSTAKLLIQHGADIDQGCPTPNNYWTGIKISCFFTAAHYGNGDLVRFFLEEVNPNLLSQTGTQLETAVHCAAGFYTGAGDEFPPESSLMALCEKGANLEILDASNRTALQRACEMENFLCVMKLIDAGASYAWLSLNDVFEAEDYANDANGRNALAIKLMKLGLDVNVARDGMTPLYYACEETIPELIEELLDHGANPEPEGYKPGESQSIVLEGVRWLVDLYDCDWSHRLFRKLVKGVDMDALRRKECRHYSDEDSQTILTHYIHGCAWQTPQNLRRDGLCLILELGATVDAPNGQGMTPIHHCLVAWYANMLEKGLVNDQKRQKLGNEV